MLPISAFKTSETDIQRHSKSMVKVSEKMQLTFAVAFKVDVINVVGACGYSLVFKIRLV